MVHGIQIPCKLEHEVEGDTTFSCREDNHQKPVFCIVSHGGRGPSLCDSLGIGIVENGIEMHEPEDQAFSVAVISKSQLCQAFVKRMIIFLLTHAQSKTPHVHFSLRMAQEVIYKMEISGKAISASSKLRHVTS